MIRPVAGEVAEAKVVIRGQDDVRPFVAPRCTAGRWTRPKGRTRATNQAALDQLLEVRHVERSIFQKGFDRYPAHSNVVFK